MSMTKVMHHIMPAAAGLSAASLPAANLTVIANTRHAAMSAADSSQVMAAGTPPTPARMSNRSETETGDTHFNSLTMFTSPNTVSPRPSRSRH